MQAEDQLAQGKAERDFDSEDPDEVSGHFPKDNLMDRS